MSKYIKNLMQQELERRFEGINEFVIVNTIGIDGTSNNELRGKLKDKGINLAVVKNSMMLKALESMGVDNAQMLFEGPCTLVYGGDSVVDVSKEIVDIGKKVKQFTIKGAFVEGECLDEKQAIELSKMPTRAELHAKIAGAAMSPGSKLVGAIAGPAGVIAGCIKSVIEKAEKEAA